MKRTIRLTESELRNIIQESVRRILNETEDYGSKQTVEKIPTWALPYLINGDPSGLEDEDIAMVDKWQNKSGVYNVCVHCNEPFAEVYLRVLKDSAHRHVELAVAFPAEVAAVLAEMAVMLSAIGTDNISVSKRVMEDAHSRCST